MALFELVTGSEVQLPFENGFAPRTKSTVPRPFLKWAGGKAQILTHLLERVDAAGSFETYHEPFLGGGALFFELARTQRLRGRANLSDINEKLVTTYLGVRDHLDDVLKLLENHAQRHNEEYYYHTRALKPSGVPERAAWLIYLNKTCYNGLYRENSKGKFNVPIGRYQRPTIKDERNLRAASAALQEAEIKVVSFEQILDAAAPNDLVYFDPPYDPVSQTAYFTSYSGDGFGRDDQERLAKVFVELDRAGVRVMLSNSVTPLVLSLYRRFNVQNVRARRAVNSRGDRRGDVGEVIVTNFG